MGLSYGSLKIEHYMNYTLFGFDSSLEYLLLFESEVLLITIWNKQQQRIFCRSISDVRYKSATYILLSKSLYGPVNLSVNNAA